MVELPRMGDGQQFIVCLSCPARTWHEGKYGCDKDKLDGETRRIPSNCPDLRTKSISSTEAHTMLRAILRR